MCVVTLKEIDGSQNSNSSLHIEQNEQMISNTNEECSPKQSSRINYRKQWVPRLGTSLLKV